MVKGLGAVSEYATTVVRLFPGHAESVIWFRSPVPYEETQLDAQLIADLRAWESSYDAGLTSDHPGRDPELAARSQTDGVRLARRLADQLGDDFQVEHDVGGSRRRVRASGPARNPDAAAAFHRLAGTARAEWADLRQAVDQAAREGHALEWRSD